MARKIPLLPTWIAIGAVFGAPFVRSALRESGLGDSAVGTATALAACALLIISGVVLYRMRDQLPPPTPKKRRRWFWRRRASKPRQAESQDDDPVE